MQYQWDEAKRLSNLRKHGIDFVDVPAVFHGYTLTVEDTRFAYGEQRFVTVGLLSGRVIVVIHTEQGDNMRLISARKATKHEEIAYFRTIAN
jgi:hypothetical protein